MFSKKKQSLDAGVQFDGTVDKGLFEWVGAKSGIQLLRVDLEMGVESKSWSVEIEDADGNIAVINRGTALTTQFVSIIWPTPLATNKGEKVRVYTSGAISAMTASIVWKDEVEDVRQGG